MIGLGVVLRLSLFVIGSGVVLRLGVFVIGSGVVLRGGLFVIGSGVVLRLSLFVIGSGVVLRVSLFVIGSGVVLRLSVFVIGFFWARRAEARTCGSRSMAVMPAARGAARARHPYSGQRGRDSVRWLCASMGLPVGDVIVLGGARELGGGRGGA